MSYCTKCDHVGDDLEAPKEAWKKVLDIVHGGAVFMFAADLPGDIQIRIDPGTEFFIVHVGRRVSVDSLYERLTDYFEHQKAKQKKLLAEGTE